MVKQTTYTSTLALDLAQELADYTRKAGKAKKDVIETALREFFERQRRQQFVEGFKRARQDDEIRAMTEEGMDDYLNQLDRL